MRRLLVLSLLATLALPTAAGAEILGAGDDRMWLISDDGATREATGDRLAFDATWSPDGRQIAFSVNRQGAIRLMAGPAGGPFAAIPGSEGLTLPAWSPDGTTLAARRDKDIVLLPATGGTPRAITSGGDDSSPAWSPDGTQIAFVRTPPETPDTTPDNPGPIMVVGTDGTGLRTLTAHGAAPDWSPDGTRVAFTSNRDDNGDTCENEGTEEAFCVANSEVYVVGADGAAERRLTNDPADDDDPSWSPDGSRIAFASDRHWRDSELWVMDADGTCATQLTLSQRAVYRPVWRPGGLPVGRGPCGVRLAEYLTDYDVNDVLRQRDTEPLFLGGEHRGMLPTGTGRGYLDYNECGATRRSRCGGRITITTSTTCRRNPARSTVAPTRVERIRGALVLHFFFRVHVISGGTTTEIYADEGRRPFLRSLVAALRPIRHPTARGRLAAPQLPASAWRALRATDRVRRGPRRARLVRTDRQVLAALAKLRAGSRPACAR